MIADIHSHITTKVMLLKDGQKNCFDPIELYLVFGLDEIIGGDIIDSQSSIHQLLAGRVVFIINPIYVLEHNIGCMYNVYERLANHDDIDGAVIHALAQGQTSSINHLKEEYQLLLNQLDEVGGGLIHIIDEDHVKLRHDQLNILNAVEGLHSLYSEPWHYEGMLDDVFYRQFISVVRTQRLAYVTLSHLEQNGVFGYCHGIKLSSKQQRQWFYPYNMGFDGLSDQAKRVLNVCIDECVSLDVKHTSLAQRLAIYEYINDHGAPGPIASHVGLTFMNVAEYLTTRRIGQLRSLSIEPKPSCLGSEYMHHPSTARTIETIVERQVGPLRLRGNAGQINLFDEDLFFILKNKGLIGLSLDRRILGATFWKNATRCQLDYFSPEDGNYLLAHYNRLRNKLKFPSDLLDVGQLGYQQDDNDTLPPSQLVERHRPTRYDLNYLMQSVLYIILRGHDWGIEEPWRRICIGSDFDGLINPIRLCDTASEYPILRDEMLNFFHVERRADRVVELIQQDGLDIENFVDHILFRNALIYFSDHMRLDRSEFSL